MALSPTGVIIGGESTEPIIPMGLLTKTLGCQVLWTEDGLRVVHPVRGALEVRVENGCPMITRNLALDLIEEIEVKAKKVVKSLNWHQDGELHWLRRLAEEHPIFAHLPEGVRKALVEEPAENVVPLANRRPRKIWRRNGVMVHAFSGSKDGYTLSRAFKEVGGDQRMLYEFDKLHQKVEKDLSPEGGAYPLLLRLALMGWVKAWIGGPPCRTRSKLRHIDIPGMSMPRPVRRWNGEEFGLEDLTQFEQDQVFLDDVLMMRFLMLYVVSEEVRKVSAEEKPTALLLEQPAPPEDLPQCVSMWRTPEWLTLMKLYNMDLQTFDQAEFASPSTKPTSLGGNVKVEVPFPGRRGEGRKVEGKTKEQLCRESSALSRWPPLMMRAIAGALQRDVMGMPIKLRALSWQEHVAAHHTPFRKDCKICQEAAARDQPHRRQKLPPRAGVLSLDLTGPFKVAKDLQNKKAKYLMVAAFTWPSKDPKEDAEKRQEKEDEEALMVPEDAPQIEDEEEEACNADEERSPEEAEEAEGGERLEERGEEELEEVREDPAIEVHRLLLPLQSRSKSEILRGIVDLYIRLKSEGFHVRQLHTDRAAEFRSKVLAEWCRNRCILQTFTAADQPQSNGRAEVAVQVLKAQIKRMLLNAGVGADRWPVAARCLDEQLRRIRVGDKKRLPPFLAEVLVRKKGWRAREFEPSQEKVLYLCPSFVNHGHWVERADGSQVLARIVLFGMKEPPALEHWIALEDQLGPHQERRRIRGKHTVLLRSVEVTAEDAEDEEGTEAAEKKDEGEELEEKDDEETEERQWQKVRQYREVMEEEMVNAVYDHPEAGSAVVDQIAWLKEAMDQPGQDEVLQTRIVSVAEMKKHLGDWLPAIKAEMSSLFEAKQALTKVAEKEVERLLSEGAELIPAKLVCTVKPEVHTPQGRKKVRIVVCGNFAECDDVDKNDLFASGANAVSLRIALALASQFGWHGCALDIKTAFLNAPIHAAKKEEDVEEEKKEKRILIKPPTLLVSAGLVGRNEHWEALKAVYGYRQSPRLWSDYRDDELRIMEIGHGGGQQKVRLCQMLSEPNMWKILCGPLEEERLAGILLVYVDDLLVLAEDSVMSMVVEAIRKKWDTSRPQKVGEEEVRFLGMELGRTSEGLWLATQVNYTLDMLKRNLPGPPETWPTRKTPMLKEIELEVEKKPEISPKAVKQAQKVVGELVWLSTRCRPDVMYGISRMASLITKDPEKVLELGCHMWRYLAGTVKHGLVFKNVEKRMR